MQFAQVYQGVKRHALLMIASVYALLSCTTRVVIWIGTRGQSNGFFRSLSIKRKPTKPSNSFPRIVVTADANVGRVTMRIYLFVFVFFFETRTEKTGNKMRVLAVLRGKSINESHKTDRLIYKGARKLMVMRISRERCKNSMNGWAWFGSHQQFTQFFLLILHFKFIENSPMKDLRESTPCTDLSLATYNWLQNYDI